MKIDQLKKLIKEVAREVESEENGESLPAHSLRKKQFGSNEPVLSLTLGGMNKNNKQSLKDFIGIVAYEAGKRQLELIHAELEAQGKIGLEMDKSEIHKSEEEINAELDAMAANDAPELDPNTGMPSRATWKKMSPEERDKYVKPGEKEPEWKAATEKDAETQKANARRRSAMEKAGTLQVDPATGLPDDTDLWTDKDWELWDTGQKSTGNQSYRKASTVQGKKGAVAANFSDKLKH